MIHLWERLSRSARLSESDGGLAAAILSFERFEELCGAYCFQTFLKLPFEFVKKCS